MISVPGTRRTSCWRCVGSLHCIKEGFRSAGEQGRVLHAIAEKMPQGWKAIFESEQMILGEENSLHSGRACPADQFVHAEIAAAPGRMGMHHRLHLPERLGCMKGGSLQDK